MKNNELIVLREEAAREMSVDNRNSLSACHCGSDCMVPEPVELHTYKKVPVSNNSKVGRIGYWKYCRTFAA